MRKNPALYIIARPERSLYYQFSLLYSVHRKSPSIKAKNNQILLWMQTFLASQQMSEQDRNMLTFVLVVLRGYFR
jgi:hypothetical protein